MKAQSLKSSNIAGKPGEARQKRDMTAETLSFEPVYADDCTLAPTISMARTMRFKQPGIAKGKQPTGTTVDASCGNPLCFATEHVMLRRWKSFGGKWSPLATKLAGCRWADLLICRITPATKHRGTGCAAAWALRLPAGWCGSRRSLCPPAASASRAEERGKWASTKRCERFVSGLPVT
jgi:hypothetical protein